MSITIMKIARMKMSNIIKVTIKNVYGNDYIYPVCEKAKLFTKITGRKTLSRETLEIIKELGYEVEFIQPDIL